jgi:hypothetical protein
MSNVLIDLQITRLAPVDPRIVRAGDNVVPDSAVAGKNREDSV